MSRGVLSVQRPVGRAVALPGVALLRAHGWIIACLALALGMAQLPSLLAACCAPPGDTGLGTVWFVNDFAQYESAMRQGAERADWLIRDPFTAEPHAPAFMYPLYVGLGKLAAASHLPAAGLERCAEVLARGLLVLALWRFARAFARGPAAARAAFLLALFGGGVLVPAALAWQALGLGEGSTGSWAYETNTFGLLFAAPHLPLAMAATLELAGWLRPGRSPTRRALLGAAALGAALALLNPFHVPVLLAALATAGLVWWRTGRGAGTLAACLAAALAALPALLPSVAACTLDPLWGATYTRQNLLPTPAPPELLGELGVTLALALGGALALRRRVAPFGLLVWLLLAGLAIYLPVPYQRRLGFGAHPALAVLAANTLVIACAGLGRRRAALARLGVAAAAFSSPLLVLVFIVVSGVRNAPLPIYRSTVDLDAAAGWLDAHAQSGEVILAGWDQANYLAPRTPASVFAGHPVATLHSREKQRLVEAVFAQGGDLELARRLGAQWLVEGPGAVDRPGLTAVFQAGSVRVYRVAERP